MSSIITIDPGDIIFRQTNSERGIQLDLTIAMMADHVLVIRQYPSHASTYYANGIFSTKFPWSFVIYRGQICELMVQSKL